MSCTRKCLLCDRPADDFMHLHITTAKGEDTALCTRCCAVIAHITRTMRHAYMNGGSVFDHYWRRNRDSAPMEVEVPEDLRRQVNDVLNNMFDGASQEQSSEDNGWNLL